MRLYNVNSFRVDLLGKMISLPVTGWFTGDGPCLTVAFKHAPRSPELDGSELDNTQLSLTPAQCLSLAEELREYAEVRLMAD